MDRASSDHRNITSAAMSIIGPSEHHQCCNGALPDGRSIVGQSEHDWRCNGALPGGRSVAGASRVSTYLTRSKLLVDPIYTLLFFLQCRSLHMYLLLLVLDDRCWWSSNPAAPPREARMSGEVMSHLQPLILAHNSLTERPDSFKLESCA